MKDFTMTVDSDDSRIKDTIREWTVAKHPSIEDNYFLAPELKRGYNPCIIGRSSSNTQITTSLIKNVEKRIITTRSGSRYVLVGYPAEHFLSFLRNNNIEYVDDDPLGSLINKFIRI